MIGNASLPRGQIFLPDPIVRHHPLAHGLMTFWLTVPGLDGGNKWYDLHGLRNGTLTNMSAGGGGWKPSTRPGGYGHVLFDGTDDSVVGPSVQFSGAAEPLTLAAWFNSSSIATSQGIVYTNNAGTQRHQIEVASSKFEALSRGAGSTAAVCAPTLTSNTWYFGVGVWANSSSRKAYLNGGSQASDTTSQAISGPFGFGAGKSGGSTPQPFIGAIDSVMCYSRALSAAEVHALYLESRLGFPELLRRGPSRPRRTLAAAFKAAWARFANSLISPGTA